MKRRMLLLLCGMAALAAPLAAAPSALAGTYQISVDTTQDIDSWTLTKTTAYYGCRLGSRPGVCADADVPLPTPLRIFAYGLVATDSEASWAWVAPPTVSIAGGSVTVAYKTSSYSRVVMKARLRSGSFSTQPALHTASDDGTATWGIPAGNEAVGIYLKTITGHNYTDKWQKLIPYRPRSVPRTDVRGVRADPCYQSCYHPAARPTPRFRCKSNPLPTFCRLHGRAAGRSIGLLVDR
jgi:hypothetical protein